MIRLSCLLSFLIAASASAVTMDWTPIGDPGNPADTEVMTCCDSSIGTTGYGSVGYDYYIGTYEVTAAQWTEFLNAKAAVSDPYFLFNSEMSLTGIYRSGSSGSYTYALASDFWTNHPIHSVPFYSALRFANWMNNGQGNGDTETGAYTLLGGTPTPSNGATVTRNAGATIALPSQDEWYKAAYYSASTTSYFDYPTGTDTPPSCTGPSAAPNSASCNQPGFPTRTGSYPNSASPYGTFDQGGNVLEWTEGRGTALFGAEGRVLRGGAYSYDVSDLSAAWAAPVQPFYTFRDTGLRLAYIPEPGTGLLVIAGLLGFGVRRRARA